ncbi:hypothetical protein FQN55_000276 [Onygenales sp. PD_40]|nr:hypothetical protein FQN55_000276 [Onygenales sp. PD_40]
MPLDEEGAKWSCEPCVRGHRSSKCQHFDRLMMKVPKAGRPLAKCPHPKGTCSCQKLYAFMVRIPKGSTCLCRPLYQVPMVVTETGAVQPAPSSPGLPSAPAINPNRIQKRSRRQNSLQAAPELVAKGLNSMVPAPNEYNPDVSNEQNQPTLNIQPSYNPQYQAPIPPQYRPGEISNMDSTSRKVYGVQSQNSGTNLGARPASGGCCGKKQQPEPPSQPVKSCCSGKSSKREEHGDKPEQLKEEETTVSQLPFSQTPANSVPAYPPTWSQRSFSTPELAGQAHTNYNSTLSYMPNGTASPDLRLNHGTSAPVTGYSSPDIPYAYHSIGHTLPQIPPANTSGLPFLSNPMLSEPSAHNCDCGDGCQCLGCASHPFNDTTRQHIQEMGYLMAFRDDDQTTETGNTPPFSGPTVPAGFDYHTLPPNNLPVQPSNQPYYRGTGQQPALDYTGSSEAPAVYDPNYGQMLMHDAAYYEVEYPVGLLDPCTNLTGTCQCGVNCACVGCLTHSGHDGVALEVSPPPDQSTTATVHEPENHINRHFSPTHMLPNTSYSNEFTISAQSPVAVDPPPV